MRKFLLVPFLLFIILIFQAFFPSKIYAQACVVLPEYQNHTCSQVFGPYCKTIGTFNANICNINVMNLDCTYHGSPFGKTYTGNECCRNQGYEGCVQTYSGTSSNVWCAGEASFQCYTAPTPTPTPTSTPTPSCIGTVGGNCNSTPCCSPLVCQAVDVYTKQCKGTPPTPTPTPSQKFLIRGVVYNDKNNNGIVDGNDTTFDGTRPGAPFVTTSELFSGSFIGSYSLDGGGFYVTSRIYSAGSFYRVLLNNIPQGCSSARNPHNIQMPNGDTTENFPLNCIGPTGFPPPTSGPTPTRTPTPTPTGIPTPTPTPKLVACPAPRDGSIFVTPNGSQWRCISSCRGIPHGRLTCDFGDVCCEFPLATPTPTVVPTPFPTPFPSPPGCDACGTCSVPGSEWLRGCPAGSGSCTSSGCTPPPTPGPTSTPTPTPTPTPIPACPSGTRERTITLPQTSSFGIHSWFWQVDWSTGNCGQTTSATQITVDDNLKVNHNINRNKTLSCGNISFNQWNYYNDYAAFSFGTLNIPQGVKIQSAFLSLSTPNARCETAFLSGKRGIISRQDYQGRNGAPPGFAGIGMFGKDKFNFHLERSCTGSLSKPVLDSCSERNPLLNGKADITDFIQSLVASQNLNSVSFQLNPDFKDYVCSAGQDVFGAGGFQTVFSSSFTVNSSPAPSLSIKYCEPLYSVSGNVFVDENKNKLKDTKEVNFDKGISNIEVHSGIDALCSAATLGIPTPPPTPTSAPSCVGSVGGSCNSTPCCSPLVCTAIDVYTKQCRGTPPPTPTPTPTSTPAGIITTATGSYTTGKILPAGTYTLCYKSLPETYKTTFPTTVPAQFNLTVGPSCSPGTSNSATCGFLPTPTPTPIRGCRQSGPVGGSCSGVTCCSGLACNPGDIYNRPFCPNPPPLPPPPNRDIINANFGIVPDIFSISGTIFIDVNGDLKKNPSESNYLGPLRISVTNGFASFAVSNNRGNYSANNLPQGQYTIAFSGLPQGLVFTYPLSSLIVNIGTPCSFPITSEARCSFGSIFSLNAGVTDSVSSWFQSIGSDMRWDSGFSNTIPKNKFASILGSGGMPGIIFSGRTTPSFGQGQASQSPFNWIVGSFADPDVFTDTHNLIPTSHRFLLETVDRSAIAKKTASDLCSGGSPANCTLTTNLNNGVYWINGDLTLDGLGYTFPANKDFVILINGDLNINEEIHVPPSSTAIFSAKGSITVNRAIGESASSETPTLEGLYSADSNFVADGNRNCSLGRDLRLNVAGTVIANAGRTGGSFINRRDLCAGNSSFPSVSFIERPDFMLNYPNLVQQTTRAWQDVAP